MSKRYHGLDFSRAILMILGVFYHSALIYTQGGSWLVAYDERSIYFSALCKFLHYFRMEAFYMLAGFFFMLILSRKGIKKSMFDRAIKIAVPMLTAGLFVNVIMDILLKGQSEVLSVDYFIDGRWLYHLWFLGNLFVYYFIGVFLFNLINRLSDSIKYGLFLIIITPLVATILNILGSSLYDGNFIFITFSSFYYYLPYFILGMWFWRYREVFEGYCNLRWFFVFITFFVFSQSFLHFTNLSEFSFSLLENYSRMCLALSSVIVLNAIGSKPNTLIRKMVGSSYSVYLYHHPFLVVFFFYVISGFDLNKYMSFTILSITTLVFCYVFHFRFVARNTGLLLVSNGILNR